MSVLFANIIASVINLINMLKKNINIQGGIYDVLHVR